MNDKLIKLIEDKINQDGGCLCEVWNEKSKNPNKKIMIVKNVNKLNSPAIFNDGWSCAHYKNARPIKKEIEKYIL